MSRTTQDRLTSFSGVVADDNIWSFIEPQMSIVAACLPTLAPLFQGGRDPASIIRSVRSIFSLRSASSKTRGQGSDVSKVSVDRENKETSRPWLKLDSDTKYSNNITHEQGIELDNVQNGRLASNGIAVQNVLRTEIETV